MFFHFILITTLHLLHFSFSSSHSDDIPPFESLFDYSALTYYSTFKLLNTATNYKLHSHPIPYGSGSGQQSVTAVNDETDPNSLWMILGALDKYPEFGQAVKCNDVIRMQHINTGKYLHSHLHISPLSRRQEVSAFGSEERESDRGDNWRVECSSNEILWKRSSSVSLVHVDTGKRLYTRKSDMFDNYNCRGCPIINQLEMSAANVKAEDLNAKWMIEDGLFFPLKRDNTQKLEELHSESEALDTSIL